MRHTKSKLVLHRETVYRLEAETLEAAELREARGGIISTDTPQCTFSARCATKAPVCA